MNWFRKQTTQLDKSIRGLHYQIILFGVIGTLLAAFEFEIWIALTTAIVGAIISYGEYNQYEKRLTSYNMAVTDLESIRIWWRSLPEDEKHTQETYEILTSLAEGVMEDEAQRWLHTIEDALEKLHREPRKSGAGIPLSSLPPVPEDAGLPPVDLTPADIIAGNWRGSQFPDRTPPPFDPRTHDDFPTSSLDWNAESSEDFPDSPKPPIFDPRTHDDFPTSPLNWEAISPEDSLDSPKPSISEPPRPEDFPTSPLDWDSLSPEDFPDAPKLSPDVREELDRLIASDEKRGAHLSEEMDTDEVPELSPEEIKELDEFFTSDQVNGSDFSKGSETDEIASEDSTEEEPLVEDSFLPFGDIDFSDDDVIVDDFIPGKAADQESKQANKAEES